MSSRGFSLVLALLLVLSIGTKTAATARDPTLEPGITVSAVQRLLEDAGYDADIVHLNRSPGVLVKGVLGGCRILAGEYPVHDTFAAVYGNLAAQNGRLQFAHRGALHETPPKTRAMFDFFLWRELSRIGIAAQRAPVDAVIASPACRTDALPWDQVALLEN
jgi:hypothetical protein